MILPRVRFTVVLAAIAFFFGSSHYPSPTDTDQADTGRRRALVIGNSDYTNRHLRNAVNDARAMKEALSRAAFDVTLVLDADREAMEQAINEFIRRTQPGDTALFYFSGHGAQVEGATYLLPTDFFDKEKDAIRYYCHSASLISARMAGAGASVDIAIIDTCRDEQYYEVTPSAPGPQAVNPRRGSCILYSTVAGSKAIDSPQADLSLFTKHFVEAMQSPDYNLIDIFQEVSDAVMQQSGGKQQPAIFLTGRAGEFRFFPPREDRGNSAGCKRLESLP